MTQDEAERGGVGSQESTKEKAFLNVLMLRMIREQVLTGKSSRAELRLHGARVLALDCWPSIALS